MHDWPRTGDEHLHLLGVDRARLGSEQDTRWRFLRAIRTGDPLQAAMAFAITIDEDLAGYTLLNRYAPETNYSQWHITRPHLRAVGLSTALYPYRLKMYFDHTPIVGLIHQTRTSNVGVNRMLDKYVPIAETRYVESPDGVAGPGEFHMRYVRREDLGGFFEKASLL